MELNRLVAMSGAAAEPLVFGGAVWGDADLKGVLRLFEELKPP